MVFPLKYSSVFWGRAGCPIRCGFYGGVGAKDRLPLPGCYIFRRRSIAAVMSFPIVGSLEFRRLKR